MANGQYARWTRSAWAEPRRSAWQPREPLRAGNVAEPTLRPGLPRPPTAGRHGAEPASLAAQPAGHVPQHAGDVAQHAGDVARHAGHVAQHAAHVARHAAAVRGGAHVPQHGGDVPPRTDHVPRHAGHVPHGPGVPQHAPEHGPYLAQLGAAPNHLCAAAASGGGWDGGHGGGDAQRVAEPPAAGPRRGGAAHAQLQRAVRPLRPPQQHAVVSHPQGGDATQGHSLY